MLQSALPTMAADVVCPLPWPGVRGESIELVDPNRVVHVKQQTAFTLEEGYRARVQSVRFERLSGDGAPQVVVETIVGDFDWFHSYPHIYGLERGRLQPWFAAPIRAAQWASLRYTLALDLARTREQAGRAVCFTQTRVRDGGVLYVGPYEKTICIPR